MTDTATTHTATSPATETEIGHPIRFPIRVDDAWRITCRCHWWTEIAAPV